MADFDRELIQAFENQLDPAHPEAGSISAKVIGYGEMSCVLDIGPYRNLVFKRMSGFDSVPQMQAYRAVIDDYCRILRETGIEAVETECIELTNPGGGYSLYLVQPRVPAEHLGNRRLAELSGSEFNRLIRDTLDAFVRLWTRNAERAPAERIGIDGQISNWAYARAGDGFRLSYFDVGTPFIRRDAKDQLDGEVHLKAMPFFLRPIVRALFMKDVLDRYYDFRLVLIDFLANFLKEGQAEKIDPALAVISSYLQNEAMHLSIPPINRGEVEKYYKEDKFIWTIFLAFRRFDRFLTTRILRKRYNYILPGRIRR